MTAAALSIYAGRVPVEAPAMPVLQLPADRDLWFPHVVAWAYCSTNAEAREAVLPALVQQHRVWLRRHVLAQDYKTLFGNQKDAVEKLLQRHQPKHDRKMRLASILLTSLVMRGWSKNQGFDRAVELLRAKGYRTGLSTRTLEADWNEYEPVAHLAAGVMFFFSLDADNFEALQRMMPKPSADGFEALLTLNVARLFQAKARDSVPERAKESFANPDVMLAIPDDVPRVDLSMSAVPGIASSFIGLPLDLSPEDDPQK